jgi:hypothetical protein
MKPSMFFDSGNEADSYYSLLLYKIKIYFYINLQ